MLRTRRSGDVFARFSAAYTGGYAIWLIYGLSINSAPLMVVDVFGLLCGGTTLAITLMLRGSFVDHLYGRAELSDTKGSPG
jgi:hypothetical protein